MSSKAKLKQTLVELSEALGYDESGVGLEIETKDGVIFAVLPTEVSDLLMELHDLVNRLKEPK